MIIFVTTSGHRYTHEKVVGRVDGADVRLVGYDELFAQSRLPRATYVFMDLERLSAWQLRQAAGVHRQLLDAGVRILNDPARWTSRFGLLRKLHLDGLNDFNAYRVEEGLLPSRWPVFLRTEGDHDLPVSALLYDEQALALAIERAMRDGHPRSCLLIIEYAGEPVRPNLFRKHSVFRIGATFLNSGCGHDDQWIVKIGKLGIAPPELYEEEYQFVRDGTFTDTLRPAFEHAGLEYGRADFGLLQGRAQVFEINSNPMIALDVGDHPNKRRRETTTLYRRKWLEALLAIDSA